MLILLLENPLKNVSESGQPHCAEWGQPLSETFFREDFLAENLICKDR